jgi:hypothetical protein
MIDRAGERGAEWDFLHRVDRVPVEGLAQPRASAKPSISEQQRMLVEAASPCSSALRRAMALPAAVMGKGAVLIPAPPPNAGPRIGLRCRRAGYYGLSGTAQSDILRYSGVGASNAPVGDLQR